MKAIIHLIWITILPVCFATAGEKSREQEQQEWMKKALTRELSRAKENIENHSNTERLKEKYDSAKEKQPEHFSAMLAANKKAAESWNDVLRKGEGAATTDVLAEVKQAANAASAAAYLAEITLKYAASATDRKNMVEKANDRDVANLASKLDANERELLLATRAKNEAQASIEKLQIENRIYNNELREAYEKAHEKNRDKDKNHNNDRDKERDRDKDRGNDEPPKNPGVLGR
jgi:hypothetical protein